MHTLELGYVGLKRVIVEADTGDIGQAGEKRGIIRRLYDEVIVALANQRDAERAQLSLNQSSFVWEEPVVGKGEFETHCIEKRSTCSCLARATLRLKERRVRRM